LPDFRFGAGEQPLGIAAMHDPDDRDQHGKQRRGVSAELSSFASDLGLDRPRAGLQAFD
jgi:hypothetical protein